MKWAVFFVFYLRHFQCRHMWIWKFHLNRASNRRLQPEVWFGPQRWEGVASLGGVQLESLHGILRLQVFCFLVKEKRREMSRWLNLITNVFSFSSCVGSCASSLKRLITEIFNSWKKTGRGLAAPRLVGGDGGRRGAQFFFVFFSVHHQVAIAAQPDFGCSQRVGGGGVFPRLLYGTFKYCQAFWDLICSDYSNQGMEKPAVWWL